ncbi:MAG TPA: hypothetical protein DCY94_04510, partial [Firmicutes bacterium]|nr:hypothetical protein [Bacillota bacterium]
FRREDYIYLRYLEDDEETCRKKGDIVRYKKSWLIYELKGRRFKTCFTSDDLIWDENPDANEDEVAFDKIYKSVTVAKDMRGEVYLWSDDYIYLGEWLFSHLNSTDEDLVKHLKKENLSNSNDGKMFILKEGCPDVNARIWMYFKKGEKIDFKNPSVMALFYEPFWLKVFSKTETIVGEEKEQLFQEDFSNAIKMSTPDECEYSSSSPKEQHYFKIKDGILAKTNDELASLLGIDYLFPSSYVIIRDDQGFITNIATLPDNGLSHRETEQNLLKIADRISVSEAIEVHKKACRDYLEKQKAQRALDRARYEEEQRKLNQKYQSIKNDSEIFPGVNGDFVHVDKIKVIAKKIYTLEQIREFYQSLKTIDPEVLKHICFYGGTVPYILNNASISREFGDVDMFVPTEWMERLRKEFTKQSSFEMLCDSKPLAEACMLTTRIAKDSSELALATRQTNSNEFVSSLFETFMGLMTPSYKKRDYVDPNGIVHNPLSVYREAQLSYYRKVQDFGFKARLFGVDISVSPIYEYENDIMAKSFNINEMYRFLLGVRVLNDTTLANFMRQVNVFGSIFNVLPLEYTLASKQSAVEGMYAKRYLKDKIDIEYILTHKNELGISDERLQEILRNYPDYSISIAYKIDGDQTTTMSGESYKQLVLSDRTVS